jgi:hypothetical protein
MKEIEDDEQVSARQRPFISAAREAKRCVLGGEVRRWDCVPGGVESDQSRCAFMEQGNDSRV